MAHRGRTQIRVVAAQLHSKMPLFCGLMLAMLGIVSLLSGPLLDLDHSISHSGNSPVSIPFRRETVNPMRIVHQDSSDVPALVEISSRNIWASEFAKFYYGCSSPSKSFPRRVSQLESNGYILIETSGGLNQQRIGIMDAVVVSRILNATLVLPQLDHESFWKDDSNFSDIFDADWFSAALAPDVVVVKELPARLNIFGEQLFSMRVPRKSLPHYYQSRVLPVLQRRKAIRFTKFDYRLANNLNSDLQKLRCRVNYHALQFMTNIQGLGEALVRRLNKRSRRYIALHLRFEPDMLAFSGCYYGGGEKEKKELGAIRQRWETLLPKDPEKQRRNGKCPLSPQEVGLMLRALGFDSNSYLYIASGEVYGGEQTLAPLKALFPNIYTKDSLASKEELRTFSPYSSRMAAIDYIVCDKSDVFVANNNGNMARILAGRRRYFGHRRTIRPNVRRLGSIFLDMPNMTWDMFASKVRKAQKGFLGEPDEIRPGRGEFSEYPTDCICQSPQMKYKLEALKKQQNRARYKRRKEGAHQTTEFQVQNQTRHDGSPEPYNMDRITDLQVQKQTQHEDNLEHYSLDKMLEEDHFQVQQEDLERENKALIKREEVDLEEMPWLSD